MRERDAVLGIDLGTSAAKAGIFTLDGIQRTEATSPLELHRKGQGHAEQD